MLFNQPKKISSWENSHHFLTKSFKKQPEIYFKCLKASISWSIHACLIGNKKTFHVIGKITPPLNHYSLLLPFLLLSQLFNALCLKDNFFLNGWIFFCAWSCLRAVHLRCFVGDCFDLELFWGKFLNFPDFDGLLSFEGKKSKRWKF